MSLRDQFNLDRLWRRRPVVSVLRFEGVIMPRQRRGGLSLASHAAAIERAFRASGLVAVAIVVNSPGGSPVQSALLYRRIRQLAEEKRVPVIAFAEDVAASGGYWLALAGDEIFSEETSLLGLDRRDQRRLRVLPADRAARHRTAPPHRRRAEIHARPVSAGRPVRCRPFDGIAAGHPSNPSRSTCAAAAPARSTKRTKPSSPAMS